MATTTDTATVLDIQGPVQTVILLEDRAQVIRRASLLLEPGSRRLRIADVTPLVADRTLSARCPDEKLRVDEVKVRRQWRIGAQEQPVDSAGVTKELQRIDNELLFKEALLEGVVSRRTLLEEAVQLYVDGINRELPYAEDFSERWSTELGELYGDLREIDQDWFSAMQEIEKLKREQQAARLHHGVQVQPDHYFAAELEVEVSVEQSGTYELEIEYTVPCALWRPIHRATLCQKQVHFECEAAVWQATGEDWEDVELKFSTARPTQRSEPPLLSDDLLEARRKRDKKVNVQVREQVVATTGEGQEEVAQGLPGVDDGGETRLLDAAVKTALKSDGRMRRIPIAEFRAQADVDRLCCPEVAALVHLRSRQSNALKHPILAGPVDLLRDSGYVGRSQIGFVASGEKFALGWGSEDSIRLSRELEAEREKSRISGKQTITKTVQLFLSNLDDRSVDFLVQERIPVSEIDKVKVQLDDKESKPLQAPDEQGIIQWEVNLPPHGTEEIKLVYSLVASSDVQGIY